jgi:anaerobic selenocysteine-containing dehydrogenase
MSEGLSRREFLKSAARLALLAGLAALGLRLVRGRGAPAGRLPRAGETCVNQGVCRGCTAYSGCGLPAALSAKRAASGGRS